MSKWTEIYEKCVVCYNIKIVNDTFMANTEGGL